LQPRTDLLIAGGPIWTGRPEQPWVEALAVRDGKVAAAGPLSEVREISAPRAEALDLRGRAVLPAFHDAHCHPIGGGLQQRRCDLEGARSPGECQERIRAYLASHPDVDWILGKGWSMELFARGTPGRHLLDQVTGERPAYLINRDGHSAWVNSAALRLAGIEATTPDPPHGRIERVEGGEPQGTLHEGAMELVERLAPPTTAAERLAALRQAQSHLHSLGIAGWQDAMVDPESEAAYTALAQAGDLSARVRLALWWEREMGLEQVEELDHRRRRLAELGLDGASVKIMLDGVMETFTAALLEPYLTLPGGPPAGHRGHLFLDPELAAAATSTLHSRNFQVHFHAIGDRAVKVALDAVARASQEGGRDLRHHIAHIQLVHPADLRRFHELKVVANMQPFWACHEPQMDQLTIPFLGAERSLLQYPFRALADSGAVLAGGSDWPVSTANPLEEIAVAATRRAPSARDREPTSPPAFLPQQGLPLAMALSAFTAGSAYVNHLEHVTGTLEAGKAADLVVLAQDPFTIPLDRLPEARVELTMVDGRVVFPQDAV
jgi:predicted amidohydrolase YtcJ